MYFPPRMPPFPFAPYARVGQYAPTPRTGQLAIALDPTYLQTLGTSLVNSPDTLTQIAGQELQQAAQQLQNGAQFSSDDFQRALNIVQEFGGDASKAIIPSAQLTQAQAPAPAPVPAVTTPPAPILDTEKSASPVVTAAAHSKFPVVPILIGASVLGVAAFFLSRQSANTATRTRARG